MKTKIKWLVDIPEKDKQLVSLLFDWKSKDKWDPKKIFFSGHRSLYFKLSEPLQHRNFKFSFLKIKGHHYQTKKRLIKPSNKIYRGRDGNVPRLEVLMRKPSSPKEEIELTRNYGKYNLYFIKPYNRAEGCMPLENILNEVRIQNHLLENNCLAPLPLGIAKYDFELDNKQLGAHIMAFPAEDVPIATYMGAVLCSKDKKTEKIKLISKIIQLHYKGLKKLHDNNVIHLYAHFGNSQPHYYSDKKPLFFHDFEDSILLKKRNKEYNKLFKQLDLSKATSWVYHLVNSLRNKQKMDINLFDSALKGYGWSKKERGEKAFWLHEKSYGSFKEFCDM